MLVTGHWILVARYLMLDKDQEDCALDRVTRDEHRGSRIIPQEMQGL